MLRVLLRFGADLAAADCKGQTALHHATAAGSMARVQIVENLDMDALQRDPEGFHPLLVTVRPVNHLPLVKFLMEHGANPWTTDYKGESSIYIAEQGSCAEALHILCNQGKVQQEAGDRMGWARALLTGASSIEASVQWLGKKLSPMGSLQ
ncbi:hypothetical protein ABBQ38_014298 [Trebouxia sp. C0009 RCD-2024]